MSCNTITTLSNEVRERETVGVQFVFKDTSGSAATPNSGLTWSLRDEAGNIINNRSDVSITAASTITVVLADGVTDADGDDTALSSAEQAAGGAWRRVTVTGTYNDSVLGNNARLIAEARFKIKDLKGQT
jgi:hypothetical protein